MNPGLNLAEWDAPEPDAPFDADNVWCSFDVRSQEVVRLRLGGRTLDQVGQLLGGISRQRVQQIQAAAVDEFDGYLQIFRPKLRSRLEALIGGQLGVADHDLAGIVSSDNETARQLALETLGLSIVRVGTTRVPGWWTLEPRELQERLDDLIAQAPFLEGELAERARNLQIPSEDLATRMLTAGGSRLVHRAGLGWARRSRAARDVAYLWLTTQGEPRSAREVAAVAEIGENAARETMRRDQDFVQIRPEGTWALSQWENYALSTQYKNAADVVVDVLRDRGPIGLDELFAEAARLYPVGSWRYNQTLCDARIGTTHDGLYDLTERGATPIEETEPNRPPNMVESNGGRIVGVRLPVNYDLLRGSGISVNRWLTWRLGLRLAPSSRRFELKEPPGEIIVRRNTSTAAISSLRAAVTEMGLVDGCEVALVLRTDTGTARLKHACTDGQCPTELV